MVNLSYTTIRLVNDIQGTGTSVYKAQDFHLYLQRIENRAQEERRRGLAAKALPFHLMIEKLIALKQGSNNKNSNLGKDGRWVPRIRRPIQSLRPREPRIVDLEVPIGNGDVINQAIIEQPISVLLGNHLYRKAVLGAPGK